MTLTFGQIAIVGVLQFMFLSTVMAQSFDCAKATFADEMIICSDPQLSGRDSQLSQTYNRVIASFTSQQDKEDIRNSQRLWLGERRRCGNSKSCIMSSYNKRTTELNRIITQRSQKAGNAENIQNIFSSAESAYQRGAYAEAISLYSSYITRRGNESVAFYNRGLAFEASGSLNEAIEDFIRFRQLAPNDPDGDRAIQRVRNKINSTSGPSRATSNLQSGSSAQVASSQSYATSPNSNESQGLNFKTTFFFLLFIGISIYITVLSLRYYERQRACPKCGSNDLEVTTEILDRTHKYKSVAIYKTRMSISGQTERYTSHYEQQPYYERTEQVNRKCKICHHAWNIIVHYDENDGLMQMIKRSSVKSD